ncbi:hypothetical protein RMSM_04824 [Rhodopirellula maiorica SM1]|uniref:Uncharacterized protein n=1 Tax=Rhodopirellula maiorica SM1 TaxID=1265738 RepID=M5RFL9_9BACT|nr:hypothetical protein RMSM_04824 [Rhodopirellula maiorica SM1]
MLQGNKTTSFHMDTHASRQSCDRADTSSNTLHEAFAASSSIRSNHPFLAM